MANVTFLVLALAVVVVALYLLGKRNRRAVRDRREEILDRYRQSVIDEAEQKNPERDGRQAE